MAITRHFLGWDRPALPQAAEILIRTYANGGELDLSNVILVFPGRRAARRMLELLVEHAEEDFPALFPPRMVTFQDFPELLYEQQLGLADELTQLLVWKKAISVVPRGEIQSAIPNLPPESSLTAWIRLCDSLRRQHDELAAEGLDFDDVFKAVSKSGARDEAARWKALRRIQSEYLWQMDTLEIWDRQTARLIAVDQDECATNHDIVLIGTVDMNGIVRKMLMQVSDRVTALVYAPESIADTFDEFGCLKPESWQERRIDVPSSVTVVGDSPQDQADSVVNYLAGLPEAPRAYDIAIGVADDSMVPVIEQSLQNAGANGRWPIASTIRSSRPWRLLEAVATHLATGQAGQPPDFVSLSDLVRHPDVGAFVEKQLLSRGLETTTWMTELDEYLARHLQPFPGKLLGPAARSAIVGGICRAVELLLAELATSTKQPKASPKRRPIDARQKSLFEGDGESDISTIHQALMRRRPLDEWATGSLRLLRAVYSDYETGSDSRSDDSMSACVKALRELSESLSEIPGTVMPTCTAAQALPVLLMQIADRNVATPVDELAIDLMGWLELPLDDSPIVAVAGFNEGRIPQSASSDVFLPNSVRTELGVTDNIRRYARDAWALETLLHSRNELRLIAGRRDSQGDPLNPSRLWFAGDPNEIPQRVIEFYRERSAAVDPMLARDVETIADSRVSSLEGFAVPAPVGVRNVPDHIPVTHFRDFIDCPYRYTLQRELKLSPIPDRPKEMDARVFGTVMHSVLNRFAESDYVRASEPEAVASELLELFRQESINEFGLKRSATVSVQLQMMEERLSAFAVWQAAQVKDGWVIVHSEEALECPFEDAKGRELKISGRVDRIDHNKQTGEWRVLDYKTSENAKKPDQIHRRKGEWVDLQLPLYRLLVRSLDLTGKIQLGYVHLPGDLKSVGAAIARWTPEELEAADEKAREVAAQILDLEVGFVRSSAGTFADDFSRICQDTVVDRAMPWIGEWTGRSGVAAP